VTADPPKPLLDGMPRCEHDMVAGWCAVCAGHPEVDLYEPDRATPKAPRD
jgi:hypothetical protein